MKPGHAVGDCHARRLPSVHEAQRLQAEKDSVCGDGLYFIHYLCPINGTPESQPANFCCLNEGGTEGGNWKGWGGGH